MQRRPVIAGAAALLGLGGCLELRSLDGDGANDGGPPAGDGDGGASGDEFESGTMSVTVDGDPVDLTADRFQSEYADEDVRFHFHEGDEYWYMEGERVTFAQAVDVLPRFSYERRDGTAVVTVDGTTYDTRDPGTDVVFRVDAEVVDPVEYDVRDGDHLTLEVTTGG